MHGDRYHGGVPTDRIRKGSAKWLVHGRVFRNPTAALTAATAFALGAAMVATALAPTKVQTVTTNFASVSSISQSITVTNSKDTLIATVWARAQTAGYAATTVSGAGATWYRCGSVINPTSAGAIDIWAGINASSGAQTVSITINGTLSAGCNVDEWQYLNNSVLINQANLLQTLTGSGNSGVGPGQFLNSDPNSVCYAAIAVTGGTVSGSPNAPFSTSTGPTTSGSAVAGVAYNVQNIYGSFGVGTQPQWSLSGTLAYATIGVVLRAQQPTGDAIWNDTASVANAAVLETQATPEYLDQIFDGLSAGGTGVLSGCAVIASTGSDFKVEVMQGTALLNWGPMTKSSVQSLSVPTADATNPRRDLIYLAPGSVTAIYLTGTAAATPCIPTPPAFPFISLAVIEVPAGASVVDPPGLASPNTANAQITDKRCIINYPVGGRDAFQSPGGFETVPRNTVTAVTIAGAGTGKENGALITLPAGFNVGHISFTSGTTAAGTPTHWWFALRDQNGLLLAATADQGTTAWAASTTKTLPIATVSEGSGTNFTTRYTGNYYVTCMMTASTSITYQGATVASVLTATTTPELACQMGSTSGLTTAPTFPSIAAPGSAISGTLYATVSG